MDKRAQHKRRLRTEQALADLEDAGDLEFELADDLNGRRGFRIAAVDPRRRHRRLIE
jgi:hypothetical protein